MTSCHVSLTVGNKYLLNSLQSCEREGVVFVIYLLKYRVFNDSEAISYPKDILGENMHGSVP